MSAENFLRKIAENTEAQRHFVNIEYIVIWKKKKKAKT